MELQVMVTDLQRAQVPNEKRRLDSLESTIDI
ncbi:uncharacterized protein G2W53_010962 [Senna tora]|uniref:Uncharacterized protein n=1 Tax=Senna tora TaxID=362788 RepID=A0A834X0W0_9FABA|nr:uncharacterized protein G2W53_010962 [Senna tora]